MTKALVYIETTIPSFYYDVRSEPEMVARREWTRRWWDGHRAEYELVTSDAVIEELERGTFPGKEDALAMLEPIPIVAFREEIADIVETYIDRHVMPSDPAGDALHLALASYHRCDFLLTWNCSHIANANKFAHIRRINVLLNLFVPALVTPLELLAEKAT